LKRLRVLIAASAIVAAFGGAIVVNATHTAQGVVHTTVTGNVACSVGTVQVKVDPPANGFYANGEIEIYDLTSTSFSWRLVNPTKTAAEGGLDANQVLVKGGPNTEVYQYLPFPPVIHDDDQGLTAPINPNNGRPYGLSHISFCFDPKAP